MGNNFLKSPKLLIKKCRCGFRLRPYGRANGLDDADPLLLERLKTLSAISTFQMTENYRKHQIGDRPRAKSTGIEKLTI